MERTKDEMPSNKKEQKKTFEEFKKEVNVFVGRLTGGLSTDDLPDYDFYSNFEEGVSPLDVAYDLLVENGFHRQDLCYREPKEQEPTDED